MCELIYDHISKNFEKFSKNFENRFFQKSWFSKFFENFSKFFEIWSESSFCRMKLLWCSFDQKLAILCVYNKIKVPTHFKIWNKISNFQRKNEKKKFFSLSRKNNSFSKSAYSKNFAEKIDIFRKFFFNRKVLLKTRRMSPVEVGYDKNSSLW